MAASMTFIAVYPRVCGGSLGAGMYVDDAYGLSPRVRGKHWAMMLDQPTRRSIPACAGEALGFLLRRGGRGVYPRVCGGSIIAQS